MTRFERTEKILKNSYDKVRELSVLVLGIGGVGGYVVESLVRMGIRKIILVDYDIVDITNINRQIIALNSTIGKFKVDVFETRINEINPNCEVIKITEKITLENINLLFEYDVDYIVDACDTVSVKKELLKICKKKNQKIIISTGTANKIDASKLEIIDLRKTSYDPIAKILRKVVKEENIKGKIPVLASKEMPIKTDDNKLGSVSFVPSVAGLLITNYIINEVIK